MSFYRVLITGFIEDYSFETLEEAREYIESVGRSETDDSVNIIHEVSFEDVLESEKW